MPPRQIWLFKFACWAAFLASAMQLVGHFSELTPSSGAAREMLDAASSHRFAFPGGSERSLMDLLAGLSLSFAMLLAGVGGIGLVVAKRGHEDELLMTGVARASALTGAVLLVIAISYFFVVPAMFVALMTVSYALAAVRK